MDTMFINSDKRILSAIGIGINFFAVTIFLLQTPFVSANDLIARVPMPILETSQSSLQIINQVSIEARLKNYDEKIQRKYPKAVINDVDNGIKHIKLTRYYDGQPVKINVVEVDSKLANNYTLTPALASDTLNNRSTISTIAKNSNSIIALNGTFFKPRTGVPLGTLMIDGKMYTGPIYDRVAFGIFDDGYDIARVKWEGFLKTKGTTVRVDNINQPRILSTYVLAYTPEWGNIAPSAPKYGLQLAIENNRIIKISTSQLEIPHEGYVIVGPASLLGEFKLDDEIKFETKTNPEWKNVKHIISGGPYLVKDGEVYVDMTAEKLGAIGGKNPRSAIGYTRDGDLILVAVDGREGMSVGMTLMQLANFMKSVGCVGAINLDGGGSTVMYVNGKVVNNPAKKGGIPISNAIVLSKKI